MGTDPDIDICYGFLTRAKRRESLGIDERMAVAGSSIFKRYTEFSIHALEKYGHLQLCQLRTRPNWDV